MWVTKKYVKSAMKFNPFDGEEDSRYIKKKQAKKKKAQKSTHKHIYDGYGMFRAAKYLQRSEIRPIDYAMVKYCTECGKIYDIRILPSEEMIEKFIKKHPDKIIDVDTISSVLDNKYIPIVKENK